jgi:hypothetical protein
MKFLLMKKMIIEKKYLGVVGAIVLFFLTVLILNWKGYVSSQRSISDDLVPEIIKREDTAITINEAKISGNIIFAEDKRLLVLDPLTYKKK